MNEIFIDMISEGVVVVYLDDILIFTKTLDEHRRITRRVLGRLAEHELFLRPEKCECKGDYRVGSGSEPKYEYKRKSQLTPETDRMSKG